MLMEGIQLYVMLVQVFEAEKSRVKYYYLLAYGTYEWGDNNIQILTFDFE